MEAIRGQPKKRRGPRTINSLYGQFRHCCLFINPILNNVYSYRPCENKVKNNGKYGYNNVFTEVNVVGEKSWYDNNNVCTKVNFVCEV